jgi:hypothetical protein
MTTHAGGEDASLIMRAAARAVALDRDLTHTALRVLKYLESLLNYELPIGIVQKNIARELGVSTDEVARAIRQLRIKGIIEQPRDAGQKAALRFNPSYGKPEELLPTAPESTGRRESMTPEQEMLATGSPMLFDL